MNIKQTSKQKFVSIEDIKPGEVFVTKMNPHEPYIRIEPITKKDDTLINAVSLIHGVPLKIVNNQMDCEVVNCSLEIDYLVDTDPNILM